MRGQHLVSTHGRRNADRHGHVDDNALDVANSTQSIPLSGTGVQTFSKLLFGGLSTTANQGAAQTFTLTAQDSAGNAVNNYTGTVQFTSSDKSATLPAPYTYTAADTGVHAFSATFHNLGDQTITATDAANNGSATVTIAVGTAPLPVANIPVISPASGTYASTQTVTIADSTPGATIYYTTDGSAPGTGSSVYTVPFPVSTSTTVNAIAVASGYTASPITTAVYAITGSSTASLATTTVLTSSGSPGNYSLTATVSGFGTTPPTGEVVFQQTAPSNFELATAQLDPSTVTTTYLATNDKAPLDGAVGGVGTGDFNGDGIPDYVRVVTASGSLQVASGLDVFLGDGQGGFNLSSASPIRINTGTFVVGDSNKDGISDVIVFNGSAATVLLGDGEGGLTATAESPISLPFGAVSAVAADFNNDGNLDFAIESGLEVPSSGPAYSQISLYLGNGKGNFVLSTKPTITSIPPNSSDGMVSGDINGDGNQDIIIAASTAITVYLGDGTGGFSIAPGSPMVVNVHGVGPMSLGDMNKDGYPDIIAQTFGDGADHIFLGSKSGAFTEASGSPITGTQFGNSATLDYDGDGNLDIVGNNPGSEVFLRGDGKGGVTLSPIIIDYAGKLRN